MYLEVIWKEQFAGPEETENVAEYLAIPIYEVVLLQAVQHDGLRAIEQTTDSENWNTRTQTDTHTDSRAHMRTHTNTHIIEWAAPFKCMKQLPSIYFSILLALSLKCISIPGWNKGLKAKFLHSRLVWSVPSAERL